MVDRFFKDDIVIIVSYIYISTVITIVNFVHMAVSILTNSSIFHPRNPARFRKELGESLTDEELQEMIEEVATRSDGVDR